MAATTAVAKQTGSFLRTLEALFQTNSAKIAGVLPAHMRVDRLWRSAMMVVSMNTGLQKCEPVSILRSVMVAASLGLEPGHGALGGAHLVPYKNKAGKFEAQLIPDYRGLVRLARRSGAVRDVEARVVYQNDQFKFTYGIDPVLEHTPMPRAKGDKPTAFYVVFTAPDGNKTFDVMWDEEVREIKKRSRAAKGPWMSDYDEMGKKTVVKRGLKLKDMAPELQRALAVDDAPESGVDQLALLDETIVDVTADEVEEPKAQSADVVRRLAAAQARKAAPKAQERPKPEAVPSGAREPEAAQAACEGCGEPLTDGVCQACGMAEGERVPGADDEG